MKRRKHAFAETAGNVEGSALPAPLSSITSRARILATWLVTLWLAAATGWYIKIAVQAVRYPINPGKQIELAMVWLILVAAVSLSHLLVRRRIVTLIWTLALIGVGLVMIVLSRQSVSALITIWLLALAWIYGDWLLRRMGAKSVDVQLEWVCLACTIGMVLLSMVGLTLLLLHLMSARWTWTLLLVLTLIQWRSFLGWFERIRHKARAKAISKIGHALPEQGVVLVLLGVIALFNLAWALAFFKFTVNQHIGSPAGVVMGSALLILLGFQMILNAVLLDIQAVPKSPLSEAYSADLINGVEKGRPSSWNAIGR